MLRDIGCDIKTNGVSSSLASRSTPTRRGGGAFRYTFVHAGEVVSCLSRDSRQKQRVVLDKSEQRMDMHLAV